MADSKLQATTSDSSGNRADRSCASSGLSALRRNDAFADVVLQVGATKYPVHKLILAANSPVFRKMFSGNWKEKNTDCVELKETPECEEVFGILMDFFYQCNDGAEPLNRDNVEAVFCLADKYEVTDVTELCCTFIETLIEGSDMIKEAFHWLSVAENRQLKSVIKRCNDALCWNFKKAATNSEWKILTLEQLLSILKRNDVIVEEEYSVFCAAFDWLSSNDTISESCVREIIPCIEFRNMESHQLIDVYNKLKTSGALSTFQCHINEAIGFRNLQDSGSHLAIAVHRQYLNVSKMNMALSTHMNSAKLNIAWPLPGDKMSFQLSCSYRSDMKKLLFKMCVFKVPAPKHSPQSAALSSYYGGSSNLYPVSLPAQVPRPVAMQAQVPRPVAMQAQVSPPIETKNCCYRISGFIFLVTKTRSLIQHVLPCNKVAKDIGTLQGGDVIVEFPGIQCVDMGQFDGHYLGKFDIYYKIAVKPHSLD